MPQHDSKPRRIGAICVEMGLITDAELGAGLALQETSGQVLGEILVGQGSMTRMQLADALGEQWQELSRHSREEPDADERWELRLLLEEAHAARAELVRLSDELGGRLTALESLVAGVGERLVELQALHGAATAGARETSPPKPARRPRAGTKASAEKDTSKPRRSATSLAPAAKKKGASAT